MKVDELFLAIDYIEDHIKGELFIQDIADCCYCSLSSLQKTFKYVFHMSINEYILKRKFSCAAGDLLNTDASILDIALEYGYSNAESFTRGFERVWHVTPREYRKTRKFTEHTPKVSLLHMTTSKGELTMNGTKYDLTELYQVLNARKNNAYVCADVNGLMWINDNLGREAGDAVILETMRRVEAACCENDIMIRCGGDEFVVFTDSESMEHANAIVEKVSAMNGQKILSGDKEIAVKLHVGTFKQNYTKHVNADEMFSTIADGIDKIHDN